MFEKTIETILNDLIQLDIDAYQAYEEAIKAITETEIKKELHSFQQDHKRHITDLSALLKSLGGEPIKQTLDFKGYIIEGMTSLRSITGTEGALKAMITNEKLTNHYYHNALEYKGFTQEVRHMITQNYHDEQRHLAYIEKTVAALSK